MLLLGAGYIGVLWRGLAPVRAEEVGAGWRGSSSSLACRSLSTGKWRGGRVGPGDQMTAFQRDNTYQPKVNNLVILSLPIMVII